jgi:hypothetical protein
LGSFLNLADQPDSASTLLRSRFDSADIPVCP